MRHYLIVIVSLFFLLDLLVACEEEPSIPIASEFQEFYQAYGGRDVLGEPVTEMFTVAPGERPLQYFQNVRLEYDTTEGVLVSQLGVWELGGLNEQILAPVPEDGVIQTFPGSEFTVQDEFLRFYEDHAGDVLLGLPISAQLNVDGLRVQYFENGRLEWHSEASADQRVQLSNVGQTHFDNEMAFTYQEMWAARPVSSADITEVDVSSYVLYEGKNKVFYATVSTLGGDPVSNVIVDVSVSYDDETQTVRSVPTDDLGRVMLPLDFEIPAGKDVVLRFTALNLDGNLLGGDYVSETYLESVFALEMNPIVKEDGKLEYLLDFVMGEQNLGSVTLNAQQTMTVGLESRIDLHIIPNDELKKSEFENYYEISEDVHIKPEITAAIYGDSFEVDQGLGSSRPFVKDVDARWIWMIKPLDNLNNDLVLQISIPIFFGKNKDIRELTPFVVQEVLEFDIHKNPIPTSTKTQTPTPLPQPSNTPTYTPTPTTKEELTDNFIDNAPDIFGSFVLCISTLIVGILAYVLSPIIKEYVKKISQSSISSQEIDISDLRADSATRYVENEEDLNKLRNWLRQEKGKTKPRSTIIAKINDRIKMLLTITESDNNNDDE